MDQKPEGIGGLIGLLQLQRGIRHPPGLGKTMPTALTAQVLFGWSTIVP